MQSRNTYQGLNQKRKCPATNNNPLPLLSAIETFKIVQAVTRLTRLPHTSYRKKLISECVHTAWSGLLLGDVRKFSIGCRGIPHIINPISDCFNGAATAHR